MLLGSSFMLETIIVSGMSYISIEILSSSHIYVTKQHKWNWKLIKIPLYENLYMIGVSPVYKQSGLSHMQCLLLSASLTVMEVAPPFCPYRLNCLPGGRKSRSTPAFKYFVGTLLRTHTAWNITGEL